MFHVDARLISFMTFSMSLVGSLICDTRRIIVELVEEETLSIDFLATSQYSVLGHTQTHSLHSIW
jgi:hypothetical protein